MSITKAILQCLVGKTITAVKILEDSLTLELKSGEKITLHVSLNKGVSYNHFKEKPNIKLDRVTRQSEKALANNVVESSESKRKHKKKEVT